MYSTVHGSKVDRYTRWRKRRSGNDCQKSSYGGCIHKGGGEHGVLGSIYREREEER
jgi:hypothetical protein